MTETEKIDRIDARILKELLIDGRKDFKAIAGKSKVTQNVIWQHYTSLKKKGIVVGSTIQIDYRSLGYGGAASFFVDVPVKEQLETAKLMRKIPGLYDVYRWGSHSRLWAVSDFMRTDQVDRVKLLIGKIPSVLKLEVEIWTNHKNTPENLSALGDLCGKLEGMPAKEPDLRETLKIDDLDKQLIEKLKANSRASFSEIGKELAISTSTAIKRFNFLLKNRIIRPLIQINPANIGYNREACFRLMINTQTNVDAISARICKIPDVIGVVTTIGMYDLSVFAAIKNLEHFTAVEEKIASAPGIKEMDTAALNEFPILPYPGEHMSSF